MAGHKSRSENNFMDTSTLERHSAGSVRCVRVQQYLSCNEIIDWDGSMESRNRYLGHPYVLQYNRSHLDVICIMTLLEAMSLSQGSLNSTSVMPSSEDDAVESGRSLSPMIHISLLDNLVSEEKLINPIHHPNQTHCYHQDCLHFHCPCCYQLP